jgi:hypothetical protein
MVTLNPNADVTTMEPQLPTSYTATDWTRTPGFENLLSRQMKPAVVGAQQWTSPPGAIESPQGQRECGKGRKSNIWTPLLPTTCGNRLDNHQSLRLLEVLFYIHCTCMMKTRTWNWSRLFPQSEPLWGKAASHADNSEEVAPLDRTLLGRTGRFSIVSLIFGRRNNHWWAIDPMVLQCSDNQIER